MTSEHAELVGEMSALERMPMGERLKHAKKRRAQQLKAFAQYEKHLGKEAGSAGGKKAKKGAKGGAAGATGVQRLKSVVRIRFEPSILLLDAASRNDRDEVHTLLSSGVSPDVCNDDGLTALHQCCIDDLEDIVRLLLEFGANVNSRDSELWTPLHAAATCGHVNLCRFLCEKGAELLAVNADGNMPYDLCEDGVTLDYIESEMAKAGVTQELIDDTRLSTENTMLADLKLIAGRGGILEGPGRNGETPLHIAACNGFVQVVEFLLDHHAAVDAKDHEEWQPIHCAVCWGQLSVLEILLEHGADMDAKTRNGELPIDLCDDAEMRGRIIEMVDELESQGSRGGKGPREGGEEARRRNSAVRRGSNVNALHALRRGSIHDKSAISHREAAEEAQRLQESMASLNNLRDDDEDDSSGGGSPGGVRAGVSLGAADPSPSITEVRHMSDVRLEVRSQSKPSSPGASPLNSPTSNPPHTPHSNINGVTSTSSSDFKNSSPPQIKSNLAPPRPNQTSTASSAAIKSSPASHLAPALSPSISTNSTVQDSAPRSATSPNFNGSPTEHNSPRSAAPDSSGSTPINTGSTPSSASNAFSNASPSAAEPRALPGAAEPKAPLRVDKPTPNGSSSTQPPARKPGTYLTNGTASQQGPGVAPPSGSLAALKLERAKRLQEGSGGGGAGGERPSSFYASDLANGVGPAAELTLNPVRLGVEPGGGRGGAQTGVGIDASRVSSTKKRYSNPHEVVEAEEGTNVGCCTVM